MRRQTGRPSTRDTGFTLIELLVVIVILGILAAIAIPTFFSQRKKAVDASAKADVRTIATQVESFYTDGQVYPQSGEYAFTAPSVDLGGEKIRMSPGNVPSLHVNVLGAAFCVAVVNPKATRAFVWQSDNGGLQSDGGASCSSYGSALE